MNKEGISIHCNEILASDKILKINYSLGTQKISFKWLGYLKEANKTYITFAGDLRTVRPIEKIFLKLQK